MLPIILIAASIFIINIINFNNDNILQSVLTILLSIMVVFLSIVCVVGDSKESNSINLSFCSLNYFYEKN